MAQHLAFRKRYERGVSSGLDEATINKGALEEFESAWADSNSRLEIVPGKEAITVLNRRLQEAYNVSLTATAVIDAMLVEEVPDEVRELIAGISEFAERKVSAKPK